MSPMTTRRGQLRVSLLDKAAAPVIGAARRGQLSRPATSKDDRHVRLKEVSPGRLCRRCRACSGALGARHGLARGGRGARERVYRLKQRLFVAETGHDRRTPRRGRLAKQAQGARPVGRSSHADARHRQHALRRLHALGRACGARRSGRRDGARLARRQAAQRHLRRQRSPARSISSPRSSGRASPRRRSRPPSRIATTRGRIICCGAWRWRASPP